MKALMIVAEIIDNGGLNMNVQERIERIEVLEAEVYERFKALKAEVKRENEFPQYGDTYWCINAYGGVSKETWDGYDIEKDMLEIGNFFQTEEQAKAAVEKLKVEAELRKFSRPFADGEENNHIKYSPSFDELSVLTSFSYQDQGVFYFESREKVQQAIDSVGEDRIKKYLFGVED